MPDNLFRVDVLSLLNTEANARLDEWAHRFESRESFEISDEALQEAFREREALARLLRHIDEDLKLIDLGLIPFLLPHQKEHLKRRLMRAHYLTMLQSRIDKIESRWDGFLRRKSKCAYYEQIIEAIECSTRPQSPSLQLQQLTNDSEKPLAWFGAFCLAPLVGNLMINLCAGNMAAIKNFVMEVDKKDVYLGWSRNFIISFFNALPMSYTHGSEMIQSFRDIGSGLSLLNVLVVNTAFAIECYLVLKNTFAGAWSTRVSRHPIDPLEQFKTQILQRRFVLLNWFFLSVMHLAAFLCFSGILDVWPWGPIFSVGTRFIQLVLASFRYKNEEASYALNLERLIKQINAIHEKEKEFREQLAHENDLEEQEKLRSKLRVVEDEQRLLELLYKKTNQEWLIKTEEYHSQSRLSSLFFSGVMMFSFLIIPATIIAPPIGLLIGLVGAAVCITTIISMSSMRSHFEQERVRQNILAMDQGHTAAPGIVDEHVSFYMQRFITLKDSEKTMESELEMKQCYLLMLQLRLRSDVEKKILEHQKINAWLSMARDVIAPLLAIAVLILMPTPMGIAAVVGFALLYCFIKKLVEVYQPLPEAYVLKFDDQAYLKFLEDPKIENLSSLALTSTQRQNFLNARKKDDSIDDLAPDLGSGLN